MTAIPQDILDHAGDLIDFIDRSPSPWHVVRECAKRLDAAGFTCLDERARWSLQAGGAYYVIRDGAAIIAFRLGNALAERGMTLIGAHTDSPGLRIKPRPQDMPGGVTRLGVEVYGGPLLATFADRDLGLAGRIVVRGAGGLETRLLHVDTPVLRLPNLAIHMNREVNESGLKFHKQNELPLIFSVSRETPPLARDFRRFLADRLAVAAEDILSWDLLACDTQKGALWGVDREFLSHRQLDNLASCHAALSALLAEAAPSRTALIALFDHEEVGSESASGAAGNFMTETLQRLGTALGLDAEDRQRMLAASFFVSADMAHGWHPNFPAAYEPAHPVLINGGPVIKHNVNQRYGTNAPTAAQFMALCETAGIPCQQYSHRSDLGCGSTIGPILAARLGIPAVDVGSAMWAMHSIRESAGVLDHHWMTQALRQALGT